MSSATRPTLLLALGAAVGVALAASGIVRSMRSLASGLPADAVARVNGQLIRRADYDRVVSALEQDRRSGVDGSQRQFVLDRLIDEELLIQRGLELGLAQSDARIRKDLTAAVIDSVVAEHRDQQPSDAELQAYYDQHRDYFTAPGPMRVRQVWCHAPTVADASRAYERAQEAARRLRAGEDFDSVRTALGDRELAPLPDAPLPPNKLGNYVGPTALRTLMNLETGGVSDPVRSSTGCHVLQLIERLPETAPPFADIMSQVLEEFRRRAADDALRAYLNDLRRRAEVQLGPVP